LDHGKNLKLKIKNLKLPLSGHFGAIQNSKFF